jgi:ATP-dependent DNA helicase RecG
MSTVTVEQALAEHPDLIGPRLLALHEDQWFDRKSARVRPRDLAPHVVALGNAEGGTLVIGLDDGQVQGTDRHAARRNDLMQVAVDWTVPPVRMQSRLVPCRNEQGEEDHLLVLDIEPDDTIHATTKDEVFLRLGDESRKLSFAQRQELNYDKGQASYESRLVGATTPEVQFDIKIVHDYVAATRAADSERLLAARGFLRGDELTIAGALLFVDHPQQWLPEAFVRVLRYRGVDRGTGSSQQLVVDERCDGPLPRQLPAARLIIAREQPTRRALGPDGRFGAVPLIPEDVWLEALVNAVVHRSYSLAGDHIRVEIFDDRIEVSSPGRFPGLVDFSDPLNVARFARNPRIARVLADLHFGQELGEGVRRMFQEMRDAGLHDPDYRQTSGSVIVTLSTESAHQALDAQLSADAKVVMSALRSAGRLSTGELSELLGVSSVTGLKRLRRMQEERIVEWVGKTPNDPRAYWTISHV